MLEARSRILCVARCNVTYGQNCTSCFKKISKRRVWYLAMARNELTRTLQALTILVSHRLYGFSGEFFWGPPCRLIMDGFGDVFFLCLVY
jgi:hypothetical protein